MLQWLASPGHFRRGDAGQFSLAPKAVAMGIARQTLVMVLTGVVVGLMFALTGVSYVKSFLYGVNATETWILALPGMIILILAFIASLPATFTAARVDPARTLRAE